MMRSLGFALGMLAVVAAALVTRPVLGQDRNFAGSVQGSYLYVYEDKENKEPEKDGNLRDRVFAGFVTELSAKLAVDFDQHISTNVKLCYGCHGFEVDMAYVDLTAFDELRFRVGRFNPSFGEFPLRHDPANHRTVDKPLPYDMGRMIRMREWNEGVLPAPYVDNGVEVGGTHWFGYTFQIDYAAYAVGGLRADGDAQDVDFQQSRTTYYVDNNTRPSGGGRLALTLDLADAETTFTLGGSGMYGLYDKDAKLSYLLGGTDFYARIKSFELRAEYLFRRTEMSLGDDPEARFKYGPDKNGKYDKYMMKEGYYVEALWPVLPRMELVGRWDGLMRTGNVVKTSPLRKHSTVQRYTIGTDISVGHGVRVKLDVEYYDFSDFHDEIAATIGVAAVL
jgi:hypothetical protein